MGSCRGTQSDPNEEFWDGEDTAELFVAGYQAFENHTGPPVAVGAVGTFPFAEQLFEHFQSERAEADAAFVDRWYREPCNDGYEAVMDYLHAQLREAGYGALGFELEVIESEASGPGWTPLSGRLERIDGGKREELLAFEAFPGSGEYDPRSDRHRTMLPTHAPSCRVQGRVRFDLDEVEPGDVLVIREPLGRRGIARAQAAGAAALLSSYLADFNEDPTGKQRHLDALHYGSVPRGTELPVAHLSVRLHDQLERAAREQPVELALEAEVSLRELPLRTLVATLEGSERAEEAVVIAAHVQEPGAVDNASGVAGLLEAARVLRERATRGAFQLPRRSLVLLWGDEYTMSEVYLEHTEKRVIAAFSSDMTGPSKEKTGAVALFEREPDPGVHAVLEPDRHSEWGAGTWRGELRPSGLSIIARCAMIDVGLLSGDWVTADHPWEGGSDHDVFLRQGIPAGLFWHFTDFAYHTSLDRMEHVDLEELRRTTSALLAAGLGIADAQPKDLERYLRSLNLDRRVRLTAAREAGREDLVEPWTQWFEGTRHWLRTLCLGLEWDEER